ncbi:MAG: T9SS type A sorting domain-containing protein, partial [Saprospiraceae bacterium]
STEGVFTALVSNICGESPASNLISVSTKAIPDSPLLSALGSTILCPDESVEITANDVCPDCTVLWSNGESGANITVSTEGTYTATSSNICGESPISNAISITTGTLPDSPSISATGSTSLCPNESVVITAENICPDCEVIWSNGETGASITASTDGIFTAIVSNVCGESPISNAINVTMGTLPSAPIISASGPTILCPGESVVFSVDNVCIGCEVNWSNGETGASITVSTAETYTATFSNTCGESPASNFMTVFTEFLPDAPVIQASDLSALCPGDSVYLFVVNDVCFGCAVNWSNGATGLSTSVSTAGVYTATVNNPINAFCGDSPPSNAITVEVQPPFLPAVQISNLCDLAAPIGSDYQWFLNGVLIPGAIGQFWSAEVAGNYVVTMNDPAGCLGTSEPVFAEACISGTFNVGDNISARVYPNPTQDRVFLDIHVLQASSAHLDLYAADGRFVGRLFQGDILPGGQILDIKLPELPAGIYQYRLATELGRLNGSLVIQQR